MIRYYRFSANSDASYEAMRSAADGRLGLAAPLTSIEPAATGPRDQQSRLLLAIDDQSATFTALVELAALLASRSASEITAAEYFASFAVVVASGGGASSASQVSIAGGYVTFFPTQPTVEDALAAIDGTLDNKADSGSVVYLTDPRLSDARTPTGTAGGDLTGTYPNPQIAAGAVVTADLSNSSVTYAKLQNVSATDRLLGRSTAGSGVVEEIVCTAAGRALIDDADAAAQRTTLGAQKTITSGTATPTGGADGDIYLQYS